jgi:hypothetical protein
MVTRCGRLLPFTALRWGWSIRRPRCSVSTAVCCRPPLPRSCQRGTSERPTVGEMRGAPCTAIARSRERDPGRFRDRPYRSAGASGARHRETVTASRASRSSAPPTPRGPLSILHRHRELMPAAGATPFCRNSGIRQPALRDLLAAARVWAQRLRRDASPPHGDGVRSHVEADQCAALLDPDDWDCFRLASIAARAPSSSGVTLGRPLRRRRRRPYVVLRGACHERARRIIFVSAAGRGGA